MSSFAVSVASLSSVDKKMEAHSESVEQLCIRVYRGKMKASKIEGLRERRRKIIVGGGEDKIKARHEKGLLTARDRLGTLFQPDTFQEVGMHIRHSGRHFGTADKDIPADAVVTGTGYVNGQLVAAIAQDFTVSGGTVGKMHATKIVEQMKFALKFGIPFVAFKDSGGARIHEGVDSLSGYGEVFYQNVLLSGVVPQIAVVCGPCAGGAAYSPALMDFVIMTRNAHMFITGPEVIKAVTGRTTTMEEVGGAAMHASVSGNAHFVAEDDGHAIQIVQRLLSYLPANNTEDPPHHLTPDIVLDRNEAMNELVPAEPSEPMNVRRVIAHLVDGGELLEVHADFAKNLIVGFARVEGLVVGLIANQPTQTAGALDIDASDKGARFIRFCNIFNIPLVTLVDVPGFFPGIDKSAAASFGTGRSSCSPMRPARRRRSPSFSEKPMAARTWRCAARKWAPTSSMLGRTQRSPSWAPRAR